MDKTTSTTPAAAVEPTGSAGAASAQTSEQQLYQAPPAGQKVLRALITAQERHSLFQPGQTVVVAVSGGADSVGLLHALHQLAPFWHLSLHVAHLDHALRPDSADDARFVAVLAQQLGLPLHNKRLEPGILDDAVGGIEEAARSARYRFLRQVVSQVAANANLCGVTIATAHHQDDQAETLLLHLVQGSGLSGLSGMAWAGHIPDNEQPAIRLVRPLLGVSRADIHDYLQSYALEWREDATNLDISHPRNRLRHKVLPQLATINPNIHATLARTADLLAAEAEHAEARDRAALDAATVQHTPSTHIVLDLFHMAQLDLATQRGVLRHALLKLGADLRTIGMDRIEMLLDQVRAEKASGPHPLVAGWAWTVLHHAENNVWREKIRRTGGNHYMYLSLHRAEALPFEVTHPHLGAPSAAPLPIPQQGTLTQNLWQLHSSLITPDNLPTDWRSRDQPWRFYGDAESCGDLYLTTFQQGMTIAPLGMGGHHRALGDIFTDRKIAPYLRPGWPVVVNAAGMIVWLCGITLSEIVRVQPATRTVRQLLWQRLETSVAP